MNQIIRVSKDNIDVLGTAGTAPNNLNYSSDYNTLKYYADGTLQIVVNRANSYGTAAAFPSGTAYYNIGYGTVTHNLGYYPFYTAFVQSGTTGQWNMAPQFTGDSGFFSRHEAFAGTSKLEFQFHFNTTFNSGFSTADFKYKIFRNNLGL